MATYEVNVLNPKADRLLQDLADLKLISLTETSEPDALLSEKVMAKTVKAAEKGESIAWAEFKREAQTWKNKFTK